MIDLVLWQENDEIPTQSKSLHTGLHLTFLEQTYFYSHELTICQGTQAQMRIRDTIPQDKNPTDKMPQDKIPRDNIPQYEKWTKSHNMKSRGKKHQIVGYICQPNCIENTNMTLYFLEYIGCICVCCMYTVYCELSTCIQL